MEQTAFVKTAIENGIAIINFYHPQSNSLPGEILRRLAAEISTAGHNQAVKVIVIKSEGEKAFCAGASFDELISIKDLATGINFFSGFASVINAIRKAPKFVIARVQGKAVGGGVGIASAAVVVAATVFFALETHTVYCMPKNHALTVDPKFLS